MSLSAWSEYPAALTDGRPGADLSYAPLQGSPGLDGVGSSPPETEHLRQMSNMSYSHAPTSHVKNTPPYSGVNGMSLSGENVNPLIHPAAMGYHQSAEMYSKLSKSSFC